MNEYLPLISINIPCFNRSELLKECLESFQNQTFKNYEIIVVDDGSTEDLNLIVSQFENARLYRQKHKGISTAFNKALKHSKGEWIIPFGSDDLALDEDALKKLVEISKDELIDVIYTNYQEFDHISRQVVGRSNVKPVTDFSMLLKNQCIPHGGSMWRKSNMPKYDETLKSAVDWELMLTGWEKGLRFFFFPDNLWSFRTGNLEREFQTERQINSCREVLKRRGVNYDKRYD